MVVAEIEEEGRRKILHLQDQQQQKRSRPQHRAPMVGADAVAVQLRIHVRRKRHALPGEDLPLRTSALNRQPAVRCRACQIGQNSCDEKRLPDRQPIGHLSEHLFQALQILNILDFKYNRRQKITDY